MFKYKSTKLNAGLLTLALISSLFLGLKTTEAASVGISPPVITIPKLLINSSQTRTITVFASDDKSDSWFDISPGGKLADHIVTPKELLIPAGKRSQKIELTINAGNLAVGDYVIPVTIFNKPDPKLEAQNKENSKKSKGSNVSVVSGAKLLVKFTTTGEQSLSYEFKYLKAFETEVGSELTILYVIDNTGNVTWKPTKILFTFTDKKDPNNNSSLKATANQIPFFKPGLAKQTKFNSSHKLIPGKYEVRADFFNQAQKVGTLTSNLNVYQKNTLKQKGELETIVTNKKSYKPGEKIKLEATFRNNGAIQVKSFLVTEILLAGELVDILRTKEFILDVNEKTTLNQYLDLKKEGTYKINSYVEYGNKKTATQTTEIIITKNPKNLSETGTSNTTDSLATTETTTRSEALPNLVNYLLLLIIIVIILIITLRFKHKKKDPLTPPTKQPSQTAPSPPNKNSSATSNPKQNPPM